MLDFVPVPRYVTARRLRPRQRRGLPPIRNASPWTAIARGGGPMDSPPVELLVWSLVVLIFVLAALSFLFGDDP